MQTILPTSNGAAVKLTTARYFTPSGRSIQAEGIEPDIALGRVKLETLDKADSLSIKEADLSGHLQKANNAAKGKKEESDGDKSKDNDKQDGDKKDKSDIEDYSLHEALNLLKGISIIKK